MPRPRSPDLFEGEDNSQRNLSCYPNSVKVGIRRHSLRLLPATPHDVSYVAGAYRQPEIWQMFGLPGASALAFKKGHRDRTLGAGVMHVEDRRVGFVVFHPPQPKRDDWELLGAIPERSDRNGFTAIHALDAVTYYLFEVAEIDALAFCVREDNAPCLSIMRRVGYAPAGTVREHDGHRFVDFRIDAGSWRARWERLRRTSRGSEPFEVV